MTRRKASEKGKSSPEKVSRRTSRRGRKSPTASPERDDASGKEHPEEQQEAEEHNKSDESGSEQEEEEMRKKSRARRTTRAKASEERTTSWPRRSSRRKSQSVEPSDKDESEREENGEHAAEKDTAVMDTIPEEKPEEVQETVVAEAKESEPVEESKEEETKSEPEAEAVKENNHAEEELEVEAEQRNEPEAEPEEQQEVESTKADICEQSRESGEVDSESIQEDESQQAPSKTEEPPKEASPEKEASEEESSSEKENRKSESPKPVRKSRFRSRSKSPERSEPISAVEKKQNDVDDKNDDELEAGEIKDDEVPKRSPEKKPTEQKPLRRLLQRKRRWLSSKTDAKASVITISTDSLKNIISEPVKPVPLSDVKLESSPEPEEIVDSNEEQSSGERRRSKDMLSIKSSEKENIEEPEYKPKPADKLLGNRKISIVSDDGNTAIARPPSPAKHHSSNILYITNLVRPFTVLQLKSLLARTGKIVENGFWIDKIKSKCYVKYDTEDEAVETRHALHGVRWPASNPKCLHVDFGTETAMEKAIISTLDDAGTTRITIDNTKDAKDFGWSRDAVKQDEVRPVREWDLGKKDTFDREDRVRGADGDRIGRGDRERERERDRDRDRERDRSGRGDEGRGDRGRRRSSEREFGRGDRDRRRGSTSVSPARKFKRKENEPPIRLLDDLFRKTKTTPCIYWLPLTVEQMAAKEEQRRKDMAENQRRQEEQRKQEEERRKERERRDRERRERPRSNSRDRRRRSRSRDDGRRRHR